MKLHEWQAECLSQWAQNGYRGIVNAVTGSGKTVLALTAIQKLEQALTADLRVKIVVPQTFLAVQWKEEIRRHLNLRPSDIGLYGGKRKETDKKVTVYVINSARYSLARHILSDFGKGYAVLLIADECHHYGSAENSRIFDFLPVMGETAAYYALGLSATPETVNFKAITAPLGPEIYYYGLREALRDQIISRFILFSVRLAFTPREQAEYTEMSIDLFKSLAALRRLRPDLKGLSSGLFFARLNRLAQQESDAGLAARAALTLTYKRRTLCHMAQQRPLCALSIVKSLPPGLKIILFCERIQAAELLCRSLTKEYPGQAGLYHSQMAGHTRQNVLESYRQGSLRLLVCCRALDEGLNIPSTDAGIIVSTTLSARQRVQRLGRILRRSKEIKRIYYLCIGESSEDSELLIGLNAPGDQLPVLALEYQKGVFHHPEYQRLRETVLQHVAARKNNPALLAALDGYLSRALIRGDFLLPEPVCREHLKAARSGAQRNYWTAVLYAALAARGRL